ncbi:enoyl-CoA hydratase/isomerase family protein [Streptomyces sp. MST-110588]|uniref:enoyl-CoA hydratase/isomerase family protein n=1 Tax=Streptomyces sp. MST-110588 TaxID=2833628 RepID=UPI001F5CCE12|nr:enoyl-CoA hydratase/isomerase family protein [Streptomyces sp. MST-110588]UNO43094.1 enoyl-CoA hydratase/isomerase family protein [Streptomyces sp. MST-110588]
MEPGLWTHVSDGTATVTISNPAKRNAMTNGMWRELPPLLERLAADRSVRVLVLTGADKTFCAGADIGSLRGSAQESKGLATAAEEALAAFPKPTVAAVQGTCVGGGCQLAVACDLRLAEEGALFGVTPAKLGIVYPPTATRRLARLVGPSAAKYLLFTGELIDCTRALRTGLVDEVLPEGGLAGRVARLAAVLASRSQLTQAAAKEFVNGMAEGDGTEAADGAGAGDGTADSVADGDGRADAARVAYWEAQARRSGDTAEGVAAFLERRTPRFSWSAGS